ncbi:ABC transporter substrate-binding protein [Azorhizobium oxalatiphilum]|uniref:ABC transporter substrate-binding protein n=1 Tax=Azorhizobium oxalatiphilum TaxID=980631 RepID=A0A917BZL1_9HYPH|nr:ABC transporter substrate-binding protein [Azorhizobium oxalatiphilum]GGF63224.1 ABC transporter substrate-binding protein [Azorhizobium oxalatiphilum]
MHRRTFLAGLSGLTIAAVGATSAARAQGAPVTLTVGYAKVAHIAPIILISDALKAQGVDLKLVEFARYADARTALQAGSLDLATIGPADIPISLANGSDSLVGLMGVGSSPKYVIGGKGVKLDSWDDIKGKKIAIAPGSAVWFQFAATLIEKGIPYNSFQAINIQGGGANFDQALEKGEVDAIVTWEPFESVPVMKGYGFFAKNLDYSTSKAAGAELGMLAANRKQIAGKEAAVQKFVSAYVKEMTTLGASPAAFGKAIQQLTGLDADISLRIAEIIKLGPVVTPDQLKRQAKAFNELGVIPKDVTGQIDGAWDASYLDKAMKS